MGFNFTNNTKTSVQTAIKQKQALFNRCKRRFNVSTNPSEKAFLKSEIKKVCTELKQCAKQWTNCGFGSCTWITKGYTTTGLTNTTKKTTKSKSRYGRKSTVRSKSKSRSTVRSNSRKSTARRAKARRTTTSRSKAKARMSYVAW